MSSSRKSIPTPKSKSKSPLIPKKPENFDGLSELDKQKYEADLKKFEEKEKNFFDRLQLKAKEKQKFKEFLKNNSLNKNKGGRSRNRKSRRSKNKKIK